MVKKGKDKAHVELELKDSPGNVTIKREWKKDSNNSIWKINGAAHVFGDSTARRQYSSMPP